MTKKRVMVLKRLREVGKLEWLTYIKPESTPVDDISWGGPENTSFVKALTGNVEKFYYGCHSGSGFMIGEIAM